MRTVNRILLPIVTIILTGTTAMAASLDGRLGVTGKAGALVPLKDDFISSTSETRTGLAAGGGLIFGVSRNLAVEVDVTHAPELDVEIGGSSAYEAALTDVALGVQYRILSDNPIVPFFGVGLDFIRGNLKQSVTGASYKLDWTEGGACQPRCRLLRHQVDRLQHRDQGTGRLRGGRQERRDQGRQVRSPELHRDGRDPAGPAAQRLRLG